MRILIKLKEIWKAKCVRQEFQERQNASATVEMYFLDCFTQV
jgi:hypothetical protein